jgi:hypothetical protein
VKTLSTEIYRYSPGLQPGGILIFAEEVTAPLPKPIASLSQGEKAKKKIICVLHFLYNFSIL